MILGILFRYLMEIMHITIQLGRKTLGGRAYARVDSSGSL